MKINVEITIRGIKEKDISDICKFKQALQRKISRSTVDFIKNNDDTAWCDFFVTVAAKTIRRSERK